MQLLVERYRLTYNGITCKDVHVDIEWLHISQMSLSSIINTPCTLQNHV